MGAQGLMQVMTSVHTDKYESFGGRHAAFDPVTNLRVGVKVLKECIARAGSIEGGLRHYVGAANLESDGGYAAKVLAEHQRLRLAVGLRAEPILTRSANPQGRGGQRSAAPRAGTGAPARGNTPKQKTAPKPQGGGQRNGTAKPAGAAHHRGSRHR